MRIEADQRAIVVAGPPVHHYCADDAATGAYAMVVEQSFTQQTEVAQAFARSERATSCA